MHFRTDSRGITLIELLVVVVIIGLCAAMVVRPMLKRSDQARSAQTVTILNEIEKALLGQEVEGEPGLRAVGYIPDMGGLPDLINGQPVGLWTVFTNGGNTPGLLMRTMFIDKGHQFPFSQERQGYDYQAFSLYVWMGWRGPYIDPPSDGVLRDGWGHPLIFEKNTIGDLTITSPGANGIVSEKDTGMDADLKKVIRANRFTSPVAGMIILSGIYKNYDNGVESGGNALNDVTIKVYYAPPTPPDKVIAETTAYQYPVIDDLNYLPIDGAIEPDGYFYFTAVPIGMDRLLEISQPGPSGPAKTYVQFEVLPTLNWLGRLDIRNCYDKY